MSSPYSLHCPSSVRLPSLVSTSPKNPTSLNVPSSFSPCSGVSAEHFPSAPSGALWKTSQEPLISPLFISCSSSRSSWQSPSHSSAGGTNEEPPPHPTRRTQLVA